ncbi:hypothetical protein DY000_02054915 [Brassica cretica]|uniref:Uncharacterized protein n=1 Tax=Brassica cretica TaxID=69181 RepID=A0ABQ7AEM5_BRACR|nr:hypothetical protein DY000_02054915 [Brassica cretica]
MAKPLGTTGEFFRRRDEWRKHPMLSNQMRHALPGLAIGVAAFCVYLVGQNIHERQLIDKKRKWTDVKPRQLAQSSFTCYDFFPRGSTMFSSSSMLCSNA